MKRRKTDIVVIIFALILIGIVFGVVFIIFSDQGTQTISQTTQIEQPTITPTPTDEAAQTAPYTPYRPSEQDRLLEKITNRQTLSDSDMLAKARVLSLLGNQQSGIVYQSSNISIEYVHSADSLMVEIDTTNIQQAKTEAILWLKTQGMSQDGVCNLPLEFYLSSDVAEELNGSVIFSPLAPGC